MVSQIEIYRAEDFPDHLPKLKDLYQDLFSGGKGFRSRFTGAVGESLGVPTETRQLLGQTIEFIHNSSLLHDDLVDRSLLRRGKTTAWLKYTPEYAVLAGDYLLARVMLNLSHFGNIDLIKETSQCIANLLEGEWLQDAAVGHVSAAEEELVRIHQLKTSSLFEWCVISPFLVSDHLETLTKDQEEALRQLGRDLGLLFQRSDDLLDFNIRNHENKVVMGDLSSGYVNSFCSHLFSSLSEEKQEALFQIHDLEAFKKNLTEESFEAGLKSFDEKNKIIIENYQKSLQGFQGLLPQAFFDVMSELPEPLYWRRPKS